MSQNHHTYCHISLCKNIDLLQEVCHDAHIGQIDRRMHLFHQDIQSIKTFTYGRVTILISPGDVAIKGATLLFYVDYEVIKNEENK